MDWQAFEAWCLADYDKALGTLKEQRRRYRYFAKHGFSVDRFFSSPAAGRDEFRRFLAKRKAAGARRWAVITYIKAANWLVDYANLDVGAAGRWERWKLPKEPESEPRTLTEAQRDAVLGYRHPSLLTERRRRALAWICRHTELRPADIAALRVSRIDAALSAVWLDRPAKKGRARFVLFPRSAWEPSSELQAWFEVRVPGDAFFTDRGGEASSSAYISREIACIGLDLGFPVSATRLRRAGAQEMERLGVPERVIGHRLGHTSRQSTERYLSRLTAEAVRRELEDAGVPGF
jgi:integrase